MADEAGVVIKLFFRVFTKRREKNENTKSNPVCVCDVCICDRFVVRRF